MRGKNGSKTRTKTDENVDNYLNAMRSGRTTTGFPGQKDFP